VSEAAVDDPQDLLDRCEADERVGIGEESAECGEGIDEGEQQGGAPGGSGCGGVERERGGHGLEPRYSSLLYTGNITPRYGRSSISVGAQKRIF
jgi:hypothetical protein